MDKNSVCIKIHENGAIQILFKGDNVDVFIEYPDHALVQAFRNGDVVWDNTEYNRLRYGEGRIGKADDD